MTHRELDREELEQIADRAAEDGEHAIVAACQVLLRTQSTPDERRESLRDVRAYMREIRGW